jgi:hypothetical protein
MGKTAEYYREYNRKHREEVNANSRLCYAVRTGKISGVRPDVARDRRAAFAAALEEITDPDVRAELYATLDSLTNAFMRDMGLKPYAAEHQALELLAALTWKGVNAPRKRMRQAAFAAMTPAPATGD